MIYILLKIFGSIIPNAAAIVGMFKLWDYIEKGKPVTIEFSFGTIQIEKQHSRNVSHITNIVSKEFFKGERLDGSIRTEIIKKTIPRYKVLKKNKA